MTAALRISTAAHKQAHPGVALGEVAVNEPSRGRIVVNIVRDAHANGVDRDGCIRPGPNPSGPLDQRSVSGICAASGRQIKCADGAVHALLDERGGVTVALVLVLLHELAHVALGHEGSFVEETRVLDLSRPVDAKLGRLADLCFRDEKRLSLEQAADAFAAAALESALRQPPFYDALASAAGSVGLRLPEIRDRLDAVALWAGKRAGGVAPKVADLSTTKVCALLQSNGGSVVLPVLHGTHPRGPRRIADFTTRLAAGAGSLSTRPDVGSTHPAAAIGNAQDIMGAMAGITAKMDNQEADVDDAQSDAFCRDAQAAEANHAFCK
jgi:hypothetical protein